MPKTIDIPSTQAAIAADPLGISRDVALWLYDVERRVRRTLEMVQPRLEQPHCIDSLRETSERLVDFAAGAGPTSIRAILARPKATLERGLPTRSLFDRVVTGRIADAERCFELQRGLDEIATEIGDLSSEFGYLPNVRARLLREAGLTPVDLYQAGLSDFDQLRQSLSWVRRQLSNLPAVVADATVHVDARIAVDELIAALFERLRQRRETTWRAGVWNRVRQLTLDHYRELRRIAKSDFERTSTGYLIEELLDPAAQGSPSRRIGPDVYAKLIASASDALVRAVRKNSIDAKPSVGGDAPRSAARFVLAVDESHAILTTQHATSVEIDSETAVDVGHLVVAHLRPRDGCEYLDLAAFDLDPLYEGFDRTAARAYSVVATPKLEIIGTCRLGIIARIAERGRVDEVPAERRSTDASEGVRLLRTPGPHVKLDSSEVRVLKCAISPCLGFETTLIETPFSSNETAWLRSCQNPTSAREEALYCEAALFEALERGPSSLSAISTPINRHGVPPQFAGIVRDELRGLAGLIYFPPLVAPRSVSPAVRAWIDSDNQRLSAVRAVARLQQAVAAAGFVIGCYHYDAIGFGVEWAENRARPSASLLYAPLATRLGRVIPAAPVSEVAQLEYSNLRFRGLTPSSGSDEPTTARVDQIAVTFVALDMLAKQPIVVSKKWLRAARVVDAALQAAADVWVDAELAGELVRALREELSAKPDEAPASVRPLETVLASLASDR